MSAHTTTIFATKPLSEGQQQIPCGFFLLLAFVHYTKGIFLLPANVNFIRCSHFNWVMDEIKARRVVGAQSNRFVSNRNASVNDFIEATIDKFNENKRKP